MTCASFEPPRRADGPAGPGSVPSAGRASLAPNLGGIWTRREAALQSGHLAISPTARALTMIAFSTHVTLPTVSPLGMSEENRKLRCIALIPLKKTAHAAMRFHRI